MEQIQGYMCVNPGTCGMVHKSISYLRAKSCEAHIREQIPQNLARITLWFVLQAANEFKFSCKKKKELRGKALLKLQKLEYISHFIAITTPDNIGMRVKIGNRKGLELATKAEQVTKEK